MHLEEALERYEGGRGFDTTRPIFQSSSESHSRLRDFVRSERDCTLWRSPPHLVELKVWTNAEHCVSRLLRLMVITLEPIWRPNEEESQRSGEVIYANAPDWAGEARVLNYDPTAGLTVAGHVRYVIEVDYSSGTIRNAYVQFGVG